MSSRFACKEKEPEICQLTDGMVKEILTKSPTHPHGIKVRLVNGDNGRIKEILD